MVGIIHEERLQALHPNAHGRMICVNRHIAQEQLLKAIWELRKKYTIVDKMPVPFGRHGLQSCMLETIFCGEFYPWQLVQPQAHLSMAGFKSYFIFFLRGHCS